MDTRENPPTDTETPKAGLEDVLVDWDPAWTNLVEEAEVAVMQEAEDDHVFWLCTNGREDDLVYGMPAWFYKALYLDEL